MPKHLPPESGHNVIDELNNIRANPSAYLSLMKQKIASLYEDENMEANSDFSATELVASDMINNINPDTCCGERQFKRLLDGLFRLIKMRSGVIKSTYTATTSNAVTPNYDEAKILNEKYENSLNALVSAVNSFRLACLNCLNPDCKKRNSKSRVTDVQIRAGQLIMPSSSK